VAAAAAVLAAEPMEPVAMLAEEVVVAGTAVSEVGGAAMEAVWAAQEELVADLEAVVREVEMREKVDASVEVKAECMHKPHGKAAGPGMA